MRTGLRGVLAKVAEADALRALRRRTDEDDLIDLQVRAACARSAPPDALTAARGLARVAFVAFVLRAGGQHGV